MAVEEHGAAKPLDNLRDHARDRPVIGPMRLFQAIVELIAITALAKDSRTAVYVLG